MIASLLGRDQHVDMHEFAGPQALIGIGEFGLELNGAGGLIDLIVDEKQMAFGQLLLVVLVKSEDRDLPAQHRFAYRTEVVLRQREYHRTGLDLGQNGERSDIVGMDDVADIDLPESHDAVDRRDDGRKIELRLCRLDGGLIGIERSLGLVDLGLLRIDILLGLEVLEHQRLESRQILFGIDQHRLILALFSRPPGRKAALNGAGSIFASTSPACTS